MRFHKIISRREFNGSAYILRFERKDLIFTPGQHINVGIKDDDDRPYSIYSGINDDYIEILVKEVKNGNISNKLKLLKSGDVVSVGSPHGSFTIDTDAILSARHWFIATGTGISPYHSFILSYPELKYRIIHGIRYYKEAYDKDHYQDKYSCCTTGDTLGDYNGRVTNYIKEELIDRSAFYFLCGNYSMIDDVYDILIDRGIDETKIKTEGYF